MPGKKTLFHRAHAEMPDGGLITFIPNSNKPGKFERINEQRRGGCFILRIRVSEVTRKYISASYKVASGQASDKL